MEDRESANLVLVLVDQRTVDVPVSAADGELDLCDGLLVSLALAFDTQRARRTAFSTSLGFDNQVPKPICGIFAPDASVRVLPSDILCSGSECGRWA